MKELRLAEIERQYREAEKYVSIAGRMIPKNDRADIYLSYIRNRINEFGDNISASNVQINIYNDIDYIISCVDEWLDSFDSDAILAELPLLIDSYRDGDFNEIVMAAIKSKQSPKSNKPTSSIEKIMQLEELLSININIFKKQNLIIMK